MGRSRRRRSVLKISPGPSEVGVEVGNDLTKDKAATERSHTEETSSSVSGLTPQQATAATEEPQETPPQITTTTELSQPQPPSPVAPPLTTHRLTLAPHPNTDLFSPAPPPGTLLILACSAQADWGDGVSKFLRTHFPEAYEVYRSHCTSIPTITTTTTASPSSSPSSSQTDLHASHSQDQDSESVSDPVQVRKARENALLDKHQRSLVGTALLIRSAPSSVSASAEKSASAAPHNDDNDDNAAAAAAANKQRKHRKHFKYFIGCLFVSSSKEGPTTSEKAKAYGDPPSPLKAMRTAMADLMGQVAEQNLKAAEWEREREKNGNGGERKSRKKRKSAVVGPEMRMAKWDDVGTTKFGVKWEMIEEGLEGLEVKVAEGMLPGEGGEISLGVFDEVVEGGTKTEKEKGMLPGEGGEISLGVFDEVVEEETKTEKDKGKAKGKKRETNSKRKRKYWALPGPKKSKK
ncbi:hypothetical protein QBC45DRAFT_396678 [Copromyces sp. CBS 386.78]|nr:hypothetical protein QBC45DRAFT_396678 [Copromyces sp. CBS 386.78]